MPTYGVIFGTSKPARSSGRRRRRADRLAPLAHLGPGDGGAGTWGGPDAVASAGESVDRGDLRWATEFLNHVVFAEPAQLAARELLVLSYERLGYAQENATWRNIYLTGAQELRAGDAPTPIAVH